MPKKSMLLKNNIRALIDSNSFNREKHTVDVTFATEVLVKRFDFFEGVNFFERLEVSDKAIRSERLEKGVVPVLDSHDRFSGVKTMFGKAGNFKIESERAQATLRLSKRESLKETVDDIEDGLIPSISVGYITHRMIEEEELVDGLRVFRAVDWEPTEISFTPVNADPDSSVRSNENNVDKFPCELILKRSSEPMPKKVEPAKTVETKTEVIETPKAVEVPKINETEIRQQAIKDATILILLFVNLALKLFLQTH